MTRLGIVVFGDVVASRRAAPQSARWLRRLAEELDDAYGPGRLAPFGFTQGDELQGLLVADADPLAAVLRATLREEDGPDMRWAVVAGPVEPGEGPATQRTGPAFLAARRMIELARRRRDRLVVEAGDARADSLLGEVAPVLGTLLAGLTAGQRRIGRLLLVEGLRQAEVADRLGVARPTVSVAAERGHLRDIERLHRATLALLHEGLQRAGGRA